MARMKQLTYHHIKEKRNGGATTVENGALLSLYKHNYLNYLDLYYHSIYNELNGLFYDLNRTYAPPNEEYYEEYMIQTSPRYFIRPSIQQSLNEIGQLMIKEVNDEYMKNRRQSNGDDI